MPWGVVAGAVIGAVASNSAAKKQEKAAQAQIEASKEQNAQTRSDQLRMYDQQRLDYTPFREAGTKSLAQLMNATQPGGQFTQNYQRGGFEEDLGRLYRLSQGEQGINRAAAARGGWNSGATLKALARFNSDQASQEYGAWDQRQNAREVAFNQNREFQRNNLATIAGLGQTATAGTVNAGANAYNQIANAGQNSLQQQNQGMQSAGEARASGYVGAGNAIGSGIQQWYNNRQQQQQQTNQSYNNWANSNSGVSNSTGLSSDELNSGF
jgi:hypothetical protein